MLKARISGVCMKAYIKNYTDKNGNAKSMFMADFYDGNSLVQIAKVPADMFSSGVKAENIPIKVYNGKFNLSVVYDDGADM